MPDHGPPKPPLLLKYVSSHSVVLAIWLHPRARTDAQERLSPVWTRTGPQRLLYDTAGRASSAFQQMAVFVNGGPVSGCPSSKSPTEAGVFIRAPVELRSENEGTLPVLGRRSTKSQVSLQEVPAPAITTMTLGALDRGFGPLF